jgi:hypothetical protein
MRRFVALSYMVGFPVVLGLAKVVPGVVFALLFAAGGAMSTFLGLVFTGRLLPVRRHSLATSSRAFSRRGPSLTSSWGCEPWGKEVAFPEEAIGKWSPPQGWESIFR